MNSKSPNFITGGISQVPNMNSKPPDFITGAKSQVLNMSSKFPNFIVGGKITSSSVFPGGWMKKGPFIHRGLHKEGPRSGEVSEVA